MGGSRVECATVKRLKLSKPTPKPETSHQHPRLFPNILRNTKLKAGEKYLGWKCRGCELVIAVDTEAPLTVRMFDSQYVQVKCPHCGQVQGRTWGGQEELTYSPTNNNEL